TYAGALPASDQTAALWGGRTERVGGGKRATIREWVDCRPHWTVHNHLPAVLGPLSASCKPTTASPYLSHKKMYRGAESVKVLLRQRLCADSRAPRCRQTVTRTYSVLQR